MPNEVNESEAEALQAVDGLSTTCGQLIHHINEIKATLKEAGIEADNAVDGVKELIRRSVRERRPSCPQCNWFNNNSENPRCENCNADMDGEPALPSPAVVELQKAVAVLGRQLQVERDALDAKHAQWQETVRRGAAERARRQQVEGDVRDLVEDCYREHPDYVAAQTKFVDRLKKVLHPDEPAEELCYPETVESDWRNAFGLIDGILIVLGHEPGEYQTLEEETQAMMSFLLQFDRMQESPRFLCFKETLHRDWNMTRAWASAECGPNDDGWAAMDRIEALLTSLPPIVLATHAEGPAPLCNFNPPYGCGKCSFDYRLNHPPKWLGCEAKAPLGGESEGKADG